MSHYTFLYQTHVKHNSKHISHIQLLCISLLLICVDDCSHEKIFEKTLIMSIFPTSFTLVISQQVAIFKKNHVLAISDDYGSRTLLDPPLFWRSGSYFLRPIRFGSDLDPENIWRVRVRVSSCRPELGPRPGPRHDLETQTLDPPIRPGLEPYTIKYFFFTF